MRPPPPIAQVFQSQYRTLTCEGATTAYTGAAAMAAALRKQYPSGCASILIGVMAKPAYGKAPGSKGRLAFHLGLDTAALHRLQSGGVNGADIQNLRKALASNGRIGIAKSNETVLMVGAPGAW